MAPKKQHQTEDSPMLICNKPPKPTGYDPKRLINLSKPKKYHPNKEERPERRGKLRFKEPSTRLIELSACKPLPPIMHIINAELKGSSIPQVSKAAQNAIASERIKNLSRPKMPNVAFVPDCAVQSVVTKAAKDTICSRRIEELSSPKTHSNEHFFIENRHAEQPITNVKKAALKYTPSSRVLEMSTNKKISTGFVPPNLSFWVVKRSALKAECSSRFEQLAKPITRESMEAVQYDFNAFAVSTAAKRAQCTPRLASLATPKKHH